jgi:hypothetical protein
MRESSCISFDHGPSRPETLSERPADPQIEAHIACSMHGPSDHGLRHSAGKRRHSRTRSLLVLNGLLGLHPNSVIVSIGHGAFDHNFASASGVLAKLLIMHCRLASCGRPLR